MKTKKLNRDKAVIEQLKNKLAHCEEEKKGLQQSVDKLKNIAVVGKDPISNKPVIIIKNDEVLIKKDILIEEEQTQKPLQSDDVFAQINKCILFAQLIGLKKKLTPKQLEDPLIIQTFEAKERDIHQGILDNRKK